MFEKSLKLISCQSPLFWYMTAILFI